MIKNRHKLAMHATTSQVHSVLHYKTNPIFASQSPASTRANLPLYLLLNQLVFLEECGGSVPKTLSQNVDVIPNPLF